MDQAELELQFEVSELPEYVNSELRRLYDSGYRYVAQDEGMHSVSCYSINPKKYQDVRGGFWGYDNPDAPGVLPAYPILYVKLPEVRWSNRSATLIEVFLEVT